MLAFLDVLLSGAARVVEPNHRVQLHRQVSEDEADAREQLTRTPLDLGKIAAIFVPRCDLILKIRVDAFGLAQRWASDRVGQPTRNLVFEHRVGRKPSLCPPTQSNQSSLRNSASLMSSGFFLNSGGSPVV